MALKRTITKVEFGKLSDELKKHYKEGEYSDTYVLDADDGEDDPAELRRAFLREKEERRKLAKELKALKDAAGDGEGDDNEGDDNEGEDDPPARQSRRGQQQPRRRNNDGEGDAQRIDKQWKAKHEKTVGELNTKLSSKDEFIKKQLVNGTALTMATKISKSPTLLAKAIAERLSVDFDGDEPELVILGTDGKVSALTLDKLEKEFVANKEYADIIVGSKASGGGAPRTGTDNKTGGGAPASESKVDYSKLTGKELAAALKAKKEAADA